ncbi:MAG: peptide ABC transporter substrate-binding protein [Lachnospiraceae bacterium]|jgi:oligopeptide transport system substrate-binding protein|nr:peptide ABC transporter substrate-binding protein [Lachnospiraceae bacterium]
MKKKKLMALFLCLSMALSTALTGCGGSDSNQNTAGQTNGEAQSDTGSQTDAGDQANAAENTGSAVYTRLYSSESSTLNYLVTSTIEEQRVGANCIDTLVEYDSDGQLKEGLATEWNYDEGQMTWTFTLREAKWVDNTGAEVADVTAQDFVDALKYELTPEYESANAQNLFGIIAGAQEYYNGQVYNGGADEDGVTWPAIDFSEVGVKAVDEHTLTYTLAKEVPYFISSLAYVVYMPAYGPLLEELGKEYGTAADKMYYNGAFYLAEFSPQERQVYKKNPSNYDAANVFIDEIQRIYNAEADTLGPEMVKRGEVDWAEISADLLDDWLGNEDTKNLVSRERPSTSYSYFYCFNFDPQFDAEYEPDNWRIAVNNENFRKALFAGLDKTKEVAVLEPNAPQDYVLSTITPFDFAYNADGADYTTVGAMASMGDTFDETKALEYKEAAMAELSAAGVTFPVKVLMPYNPSVVNWDKECQVVEQQMEALLGTDFIDIIIEAGPTDNFLTEIRRSGQYAFMKCGWGADYADPETWTDPFYQSKGEAGYDPGYKYAFIANAITEGTDTAPVIQEYFDKVEAAKAITIDTNARFEAFAEAEAVLIDHALVIPFSITVSPYIATKLNEFDAQYAPFGVSRLRFKGQKVLDHYVSMEEYEANKEK